MGTTLSEWIEAMEELRDIESFEGLYSVTKSGKVWSHRSKTWLIPRLNTGYLCVTLFKSPKKHNKRIHRLVMETWEPNVNNYPQINHKDGDVLNNNISNLEWCTSRENCLHAYATGLSECSEATKKLIGKANGKKVRNIETGEEFNSAREASFSLGLNKMAVTFAIHRSGKAGGYSWTYCL